MPRQGTLFYGWIVVAAAFVVMMVGFGIAYCFAAFFDDLQREFAASRGDVSLVFSLAGFLYFALGAVSGSIADRLGPRRVITGGMLVIGIGLVLGSQAETLWQVYATYGLGVGIGVGLSYIPAIGTVQRWFVARRGFASGLAVTGIGVGTLVGPLLAVWLIGGLGWRGAYLVLAAVAVLAGGGAGLLIYHSPAVRGLRPDGGVAEAPAPTARAAHADLAGLGFGEAVRSRPFRWLYISATLCSFGMFVPMVHLAPYAVDHGYSETAGVAMVSLIGVGSVLGRFLLGGVADRFGRRRAYVAMFAGMMVALLWWYVGTGMVALAAFAVLFGTFYGGFVALAPALASDYFGGRNISGIIGLLYSGVAIGTLLGPVLAGVAFDLMGSYTLPLLAAAALNIGAILAALTLEDPALWRASGAGSALSRDR